MASVAQLVQDNDNSGSSQVNTEGPPNLTTLLSIWPITSTLVSAIPVGDLISLSRVSSTYRALTHALEIPEVLQSSSPFRSAPDLNIGRHQTTYWKHLKRTARFICASPHHTRGDNVHGCKFCSTTICEGCIVRDSMRNKGENTFQKRTRFLCESCWASGNLRRDYRFSADGPTRETVWYGRPYNQRGSFCGCSLKSDAWLCIPCKQRQNASSAMNASPDNHKRHMTVPHKDTGPDTASSSSSSSPSLVLCYGNNCTSLIPLEGRDRRRICLWCAKPLTRQIGGDDRHSWETKNIEIRKAEAQLRSADIQEWTRNRFRSLTMSRRQLRAAQDCISPEGPLDTVSADGVDLDSPILLRHLDAINYRRHCPSRYEPPSPDDIWRSKHSGFFRYSVKFLLFIGETATLRDAADFQLPPQVLAHLHCTTQPQSQPQSQTSLDIADRDLSQYARLNKTLIMQLHDLPVYWDSTAHLYLRQIILEGAHLAVAGLIEDLEFDELKDLLKDADALKIYRDILFEQLRDGRQAEDKLDETGSDRVRTEDALKSAAKVIEERTRKGTSISDIDNENNNETKRTTT